MVDTSGFPLLHYVSDLNNSSATNRRKSVILRWIRPNKVVKHRSAEAFQHFNSTIWVLAANILVAQVISDKV